VLAYLFWHRPRAGVETDEYEEAQRRFHRRLEVPSACFRLGQLPFAVNGANGGDAYEDWYLVEDWDGLGRLNATAVNARHRDDHDRAAALVGSGWAGLYAHVRGEVAIPEEASWRHKPIGEPLTTLLADVPAEAPVWQRQLVLGPAPELCLGAGGSARTRI
jgi:hypothetical protein